MFYATSKEVLVGLGHGELIHSKHKSKGQRLPVYPDDGKGLTIEIRAVDGYVNATRIGMVGGDAKRATKLFPSTSTRPLLPIWKMDLTHSHANKACCQAPRKFPPNL